MYGDAAANHAGSSACELSNSDLVVWEDLSQELEDFIYLARLGCTEEALKLYKNRLEEYQYKHFPILLEYLEVLRTRIEFQKVSPDHSRSARKKTLEDLRAIKSCCNEAANTGSDGDTEQVVLHLYKQYCAGVRRDLAALSNSKKVRSRPNSDGSFSVILAMMEQVLINATMENFNAKQWHWYELALCTVLAETKIPSREDKLLLNFFTRCCSALIKLTRPWEVFQLLVSLHGTQSFAYEFAKLRTFFAAITNNSTASILDLDQPTKLAYLNGLMYWIRMSESSKKLNLLLQENSIQPSFCRDQAEQLFGYFFGTLEDAEGWLFDILGEDHGSDRGLFIYDFSDSDSEYNSAYSTTSYSTDGSSDDGLSSVIVDSDDQADSPARTPIRTKRRNRGAAAAALSSKKDEASAGDTAKYLQSAIENAKAQKQKDTGEQSKMTHQDLVERANDVDAESSTIKPLHKEGDLSKAKGKTSQDNASGSKEETLSSNPFNSKKKKKKKDPKPATMTDEADDVFHDAPQTAATNEETHPKDAGIDASINAENQSGNPLLTTDQQSGESGAQQSKLAKKKKKKTTFDERLNDNETETQPVPSEQATIPGSTFVDGSTTATDSRRKGKEKMPQPEEPNTTMVSVPTHGVHARRLQDISKTGHAAASSTTPINTAQRTHPTHESNLLPPMSFDESEISSTILNHYGIAWRRDPTMSNLMKLREQVTKAQFDELVSSTKSFKEAQASNTALAPFLERQKSQLRHSTGMASPASSFSSNYNSRLAHADYNEPYQAYYPQPYYQPSAQAYGPYPYSAYPYSSIDAPPQYAMQRPPRYPPVHHWAYTQPSRQYDDPYLGSSRSIPQTSTAYYYPTLSPLRPQYGAPGYPQPAYPAYPSPPARPNYHPSSPGSEDFDPEQAVPPATQDLTGPPAPSTQSKPNPPMNWSPGVPRRHSAFPLPQLRSSNDMADKSAEVVAAEQLFQNAVSGVNEAAQTASSRANVAVHAVRPVNAARSISEPR